MDLYRTITSQYRASLAMLRSAIEQCPASSWANEQDKNQFWHVASVDVAWVGMARDE